MEADWKSFVILVHSERLEEFKDVDLAQSIDNIYYELTGVKRHSDNDFIQSERNCLNLRRWRTKFEANSQRPYFERRERYDVMKRLNELIIYILVQKDFYCTVTDIEIPISKIPTQSLQRVLTSKHSNQKFLNRNSIMMFFIFIFTIS